MRQGHRFFYRLNAPNTLAESGPAPGGEDGRRCSPGSRSCQKSLQSESLSLSPKPVRNPGPAKVRDLLDYPRALRKHDLRVLQSRLAALGLSSLARIASGSREPSWPGRGIFVRTLGPVPGCYRVGRWGHNANFYTEPAHGRRRSARKLMKRSWPRVPRTMSITSRSLFRKPRGFKPTSKMKLSKGSFT